jgi:diguanylate cyclase (GGDEF)-like protein/PAS domain S-box-containing protein
MDESDRPGEDATAAADAAWGDLCRDFFEHANAGLAITSPETGWLHVNDRLCEMLGYGREQLRRMDWQEITHPDDLDSDVRQFRRVLAGEIDRYELDKRFIRADGGILHAHLTVGCRRGDDGGVRLILATLQDVGEQRRMLSALRDSEEQLRLLLEASLDGFWDWRIPENTLYLSPRWKAQLGFADHELENSFATFESRLHPEDRERILTHVAAYITSPYGPWRAEFRMRRKEGSYCWVQARASPQFDEAGRLIRLFGVHIDITERRQAEDRLRLAGVVFETSAEGIIISDGRGQILAVNRAFTEITGYSASEVLGRNPRLLSSGRHDADFYQAMWRTLTTEGRWKGEIWNRRKNGEIYPEWLTISRVSDDKGALNYVALFADITAIKQSERQMEYLAHHDLLTGLPNRLLLNARLGHALERAQRDGTHIAVMVVDLDRFKQINDTLGHPVGDLVLQLAAARMAGLLRKSDTVARLGGDEFVIVQEPVESPHEAETLAQRIIEAVKAPFDAAGHALHVTSSVGISLYPGNGDDMATLLRHADAAMYKAKDLGRDTFTFFDPEMGRHAERRLALEAELRGASAAGQFGVHYQPRVDLGTGRMAGVEALLRWYHPERGILAPEHFLDVAEHSGLLLEIGDWVLETACTQFKAWVDAGLRPLCLAINLAPLELNRPNLRGWLEGLLGRSGVAPGQLTVEVAEGYVMSHAVQIGDRLGQLRAIGVRIALDGFGSGYSSLTKLRGLPLDQLNIDRTLVRELPGGRDAATVIGAILSLAHSLGLDVLAEGVETAQQRDALASLRCPSAQGQLFSRPLQAAEMEALLRQASGPDGVARLPVHSP